MSSRLAKSPRSFPLQDKVALAYLCLTIADWGKVQDLASSHTRWASSLQWEHLILTDRMGLEVEHINFGSWCDSRFYSLVTECFFQAAARGDIFSQRAALRCKQEMRGFPQSKSLSLHRTDWTPPPALSCPLLSSLHHSPTLWPAPYPRSLFIVCPLSHISNTRVYWENIHHVHKHSLR